MYAADLDKHFEFKLYKNGRGNHVILADEKLDNERFYYLVNYLNYPENIDYKIDIKGFTTGEKDGQFEAVDLMIYISENDTEGDNVFAVTTENQHYKIDFGGKITTVEENILFQQPGELNIENPEIFEVDKKILKINKSQIYKEAISQNLENSEIFNAEETKVTTKEESYIYDNSEKRFKIILKVVLVTGILNLLLVFFLQNNSDDLERIILFSMISLFLWFFSDEKMLQNQRLYLKSLVIALSFIGYWYLILRFINSSNLEFSIGVVSYPSSLLIIQFPLRQLYLKVFKREPKPERNGKFADIIYMLLLMFLPLLFLFMISSLIN